MDCLWNIICNVVHVCRDNGGMMETGHVWAFGTKKFCGECDSDQMGIVLNRENWHHWVCGKCLKESALVEREKGKWYD